MLEIREGLLQKEVYDSEKKRVGRVSDILFDDRTWRIRFFVVNSIDLTNRDEVLISPHALSLLSSDDEILLTVSSTRLEMSPPFDSKASNVSCRGTTLSQLFSVAR